MNKNELYDLEIEVHKKVDIIKNEQDEYVRGVEKGIDLMFDAVRTLLCKEAEQDHPTEKAVRNEK
jgi:hypothetical protein